MDEEEFLELTRTRIELVMPVLNDGAWSNRGMCLHQWMLLPPGADTPIIGYGENHPDRFSFIVMRQAAKEGLTVFSLHDKALANLRGREDRPAWEADEVPFAGAPHTLLSRRGDELTASDALDPACLAEAHERLDSAEILVGMPTRSMLVASRPELGPGLVQFCRSQFQSAKRDETDYVTVAVFVVREGKVKERYRPPEAS